MDKQVYLNLRKNLDLEFKNHVLYFHLAQDLCLLAICAYLFIQEKGLQYWAIPLISVLMFRNFSLMHDAVHGLISKNKNINDVIGIIAGSFCVLPYEPWKMVHLEHHYWSGNVEKDPVMGLMRTFPTWPPYLQKMLGLCWQLWIPVLALFQYGLFWWHSTAQVIKKTKSVKQLTSIGFPLLLWGSLFIALPLSSTVGVIIPALILYLLAVEVVNFPHHIGLPQYRGEHKIAVWNQHEIARSCIYPVWLSKFVALNFNYHTEHHMFPDAPWYTLDKIHHHLKAQLKEDYNTDPQFVWIVENRPKTLAVLLLTPAQGQRISELKSAA